MKPRTNREPTLHLNPKLGLELAYFIPKYDFLFL